MQFYDVINQDNASDIFNSHGIKVSHDDVFPYLTGYCYDQIASRKTDPLAIECRGIVYDSKIGEVIARPFDRFFNYGEAQDITNKVNYSNCTTSEKLDGSLVTFYYSQTYSTWMVSTKGTPTARNAIVKHGEGGLPLLYIIAEYFGLKVEHYVSSRIIEGG